MFTSWDSPVDNRPFTAKLNNFVIKHRKSCEKLP